MHKIWRWFDFTLLCRVKSQGGNILAFLLTKTEVYGNVFYRLADGILYTEISIQYIIYQSGLMMHNLL